MSKKENFKSKPKNNWPVAMSSTNEEQVYYQSLHVDQRPPSSEKPAMVYTSSENWQ